MSAGYLARSDRANRNRPKTIRIEGVAGNVNTRISNDTKNYLWEIIAIHVKMITDATVANRGLKLEFDDVDLNYTFLHQADSQTASQTVYYNLCPNIPFGTGSQHQMDHYWNNIPLPKESTIFPSESIKISWLNGQAGDLYEVRVRYRERWL
jgi:hypothetical protein